MKVVLPQQKKMQFDWHRARKFGTAEWISDHYAGELVLVNGVSAPDTCPSWWVAKISPDCPKMARQYSMKVVPIEDNVYGTYEAKRFHSTGIPHILDAHNLEEAWKVTYAWAKKRSAELLDENLCPIDDLQFYQGVYDRIPGVPRVCAWVYEPDNRLFFTDAKLATQGRLNGCLMVDDNALCNRMLNQINNFESIIINPKESDDFASELADWVVSAIGHMVGRARQNMQ